MLNECIIDVTDPASRLAPFTVWNLNQKSTKAPLFGTSQDSGPVNSPDQRVGDHGHLLTQSEACKPMTDGLQNSPSAFNLVRILRQFHCGPMRQSGGEPMLDFTGGLSYTHPVRIKPIIGLSIKGAAKL